MNIYNEKTSGLTFGNRIIVALDGMDFKQSLEFISPMRDKIWGIKIQHSLLQHIELYVKYGYQVFVDLKLYDIPSTVQRMIEWSIEQGASMITIHFENGEECFERINHFTKDIDILVVSHLTSMKKNELKQAKAYTFLTHKECCEGFGAILSPMDLYLFNQFDMNHDIKRVCPGIRLENRNDDQVRTMTPNEAIENGADYLVIGRPLQEHPIECFL